MVTTATWGAGACSSQSHTPQLSNGQVSPPSGSTLTAFAFAVTYRDTKGCAPNWVTVTIAGVGVYPMTGSGTAYETGVTFTRSLQLPVGVHAYSFAANSGDPGAQKTTALMTVSPPSVTVTAPVPPPSPQPTPPPTPKPTVAPTGVPTPIATAPPTPPTATSVPTPVAATTAPVPTPPIAGEGGGGSSPGPVASEQGQAPGPLPSDAGGAAGALTTDRQGSFPLLMGAWITATAGGLALFLLLAPRRRTADEPALAVADPGPGIAEPEVAADPPQPAPHSDLVPPDEVNMPRWLRPSVRAARQGTRSAGPRFEDS